MTSTAYQCVVLSLLCEVLLAYSPRMKFVYRPDSNFTACAVYIHVPFVCIVLPNYGELVMTRYIEISIYLFRYGYIDISSKKISTFPTYRDILIYRHIFSIIFGIIIGVNTCAFLRQTFKSFFCIRNFHFPCSCLTTVRALVYLTHLQNIDIVSISRYLVNIISISYRN